MNWTKPQNELNQANETCMLCAGYYYRNVVTLPTNYASISLSQDRLSVMVEQRSQSPLQKPLFWASMACFFVTIVSTVGIIVICAMHWRKFVFCLRQSRGPVGRRSRTSAVDVPCLLGAKKDPSSDSSQSKTIPSCKDMQGSLVYVPDVFIHGTLERAWNSSWQYNVVDISSALWAFKV